jgi:ABC-2 type transport system ATP-binding protein
VTPLTLVADGLTVRYGDVTAVDDLSLTLEPGRIYGLLGRNGSGKTSLLSALAAFRRPSAGTVLADGEPVWENPRATRRICLVREAGDMADRGDKVSETLDLARQLRPNWDQAYADRLVELFDLPTRRRVDSLSRGRRSALGIVIGLATRAPLTMFDESHLGMDAPSRQAFADELLADFMARPRTIVLSTHLVEELARLFEQVLILDRGRLLVAEDVEVLRARGTAVTGPSEAVDRVTAGMAVLSERSLGRTRQVTVDGQLDPARRREAADAGLELGRVPLQELFTQLTDPDRAAGPVPATEEAR